MTIKELKTILNELEATHGNIDEVELLFRFNRDSDIRSCNFLEEDLFQEDNKTLHSICFLEQDEE